MALTINTKTYNQDSWPTPNSVRYTGPSHSLAADDVVILKRIAPKPTATSPGVAKSQFKFVRTNTDGTDTLSDKSYVTMDVSTSAAIAIGELQALMDDAGAAFASAHADSLVEDQDINQ